MAMFVLSLFKQKHLEKLAFFDFTTKCLKIIEVFVEFSGLGRRMSVAAKNV